MLASLLTHCENAFSPKGEYSEKLVVYCVLNPLQKSQFVRLYRTYDVEGLDPLKNTVDTQVKDAEVRIYYNYSQRQYVLLKDTVLKRDSYDRYSSDIVAYYTDELALQPGSTYVLSVKTHDSTTYASTYLPPSVDLIVNELKPALISPDLVKQCNCIRIRTAYVATKGYVFKLYIEYARDEQVGRQFYRKEVPPLFLSVGNDSLRPIYPGVDASSSADFSVPAFTKVLNEIQSDNRNIIFGAWFYAYGLDPNLYNYYQVAHGFGDPYSVRLDAPDYTNISWGRGVFGAVNVDSLYVPKAYWGIY